MNAAIAFSLGFFVLLTLIGLGPFLWLRTADSAHDRDILLAPGLGIGLIVIPTVLLNRIGLPVQTFAIPLCLVLAIVGIAGIVRHRRMYAFGRTVIFIPILIAAFFASGWPLMHLGYSWISYANDDMTNYSLSAQRLLDSPFLKPPVEHDYIHNSHVSQYLWVFENIINERYGVDELLAVGTKLSGTTPLEAFMPIMLALELALISASSAMVWRDRRKLVAPVLAAILLSASSLLTFGLDSQLIAQSAGLALLVTAIVLVAEAPIGSRASKVTILSHATLITIAVGGLAEVYPELLPFLALPLIAFFGVRVVRHGLSALALVRWTLGLTVAMLVAINGYLPNFITVLIIRSVSAGSSNHEVIAANAKTLYLPFIFPYYLFPTGFANYFGLYPLTVYPSDPILSGGIILGMLLAAFVFYTTLRGVWQQDPVAYVNAFSGLLAIWLFYKESDFGLFKLAMYSQPFMICTFAIWWSRLWDRYGTGTSASISAAVA